MCESLSSAVFVITERNPTPELGAGRSIDMDLPSHRRERFEIILSIDRHPRQPIAAEAATVKSVRENRPPLGPQNRRHSVMNCSGCLDIVPVGLIDHAGNKRSVWSLPGGEFEMIQGLLTSMGL